MTPRILLEKMFERVGEISHLVIIEHDQEGYINLYSTTMTKGDAAWIKYEFDRRWLE